MSCWYEKVCDNSCQGNHISCVRYLEMESLMKSSNLPDYMQNPISLLPDDCDLENFRFLKDYKNSIQDHVHNGDNLYIYSETTGNGKTSWAVKILLKYFDEIWAGNGFKPRGIFIHVPTFLSELKDFSSKNEELEYTKKILKSLDLVVWDDIASTELSAYDHTQLLTYIDARVLSKKSNIFTGNFDRTGMEKAIGQRLTSRIWNTSTQIKFVGGDKR